MLQGFQFDKMQAYPTSDASLFSYLAGDRSFIIPNRGNELNVTTSELNITVDTGEALILGRQIKITEPMVLTIGANQSGYLVIEIDLSKANTSTGTPGQPDYEPINNQLSLKFVNNLTQDNINDGGLIYQFNLGTITSSTNSISFAKNEKINVRYPVLLFQGAFATGTITLSESMFNYKILAIGIQSLGSSDPPFAWALIPVVPNNVLPNYQAFMGYNGGVDGNGKNSISTYCGRLSKNDEGTQITIVQQITNVAHTSGSSHTGGSKYNISYIYGIR